MEALVRTFLNPSATMNISLDRLAASVKKTKTPTTTEVKNDPPTIFISMRPAILLLVNGAPVMGKIANSSLQFVVNANWPVFVDASSSHYYLFNGKGWMTSASSQGTWTATSQLPQGMSQGSGEPEFRRPEGIYSGAAGSCATSPAVYYSATPAEIIVFGGAPQWTAIPGTQLSYASNTGEPGLQVRSDGGLLFPDFGTLVHRRLGRWDRGRSPPTACRRTSPIFR